MAVIRKLMSRWFGGGSIKPYRSADGEPVLLSRGRVYVSGAEGRYLREALDHINRAHSPRSMGHDRR